MDLGCKPSRFSPVRHVDIVPGQSDFRFALKELHTWLEQHKNHREKYPMSPDCVIVNGEDSVSPRMGHSRHVRRGLRCSTLPLEAEGE
jgi:hypothetical protein